MTIKQVVHYIAHHCGPQECDCLPLCKGRAADPMATSAEKYVTCKTCLRALAAGRARAEQDRVKHKAELYDELWALARSLGFANVTDAIMASASARDSDVPDFTPGNGNKARRRASALGIDYDAAMGKEVPS